MNRCKNSTENAEKTIAAAAAKNAIYIPCKGIYCGSCSLQRREAEDTTPGKSGDMSTPPDRFWPLLADMPTLSHWPDRSRPFDYARSEVIAHVRERFDVPQDFAIRIFDYAREKGVVWFNRETRLWCGTKGGAR